MNELDVTFGESPWELTIQNLSSGDSICAAEFLTLMEDSDELQMQQALQELRDKQISLDIQTLTKIPGTGTTGVRLRQEQQMVQQGNLPEGLEKNDPLRLYLEEVAAIPVAGDPVLLAQKLAAGDESVMQSLVNLMLSRVISTAREYVGRGVLLLDLIQEASLGLWQALMCYTGGDFETHCDWWMHQYLAGAVTVQAKAAGVGQKLRQALEDFRSVDERLLTELGRNPDLDEIADAMHISVQETAVIAGMLENARLLQRVKTPEPSQLPQEEDQAVEDTAYFQMRQRIAELLSGLSVQDARLLTLRYGLEGGLPMDSQQVANRLGLTPREVIDREAAALAKLRLSN